MNERSSNQSIRGDREESTMEKIKEEMQDPNDGPDIYSSFNDQNKQNPQTIADMIDMKIIDDNSKAPTKIHLNATPSSQLDNLIYPQWKVLSPNF